MILKVIILKKNYFVKNKFKIYLFCILNGKNWKKCNFVKDLLLSFIIYNKCINV